MSNHIIVKRATESLTAVSNPLPLRTAVLPLLISLLAPPTAANPADGEWRGLDAVDERKQFRTSSTSRL